jgi:hypothetical protein
MIHLSNKHFSLAFGKAAVSIQWLHFLSVYLKIRKNNWCLTNDSFDLLVQIENSCTSNMLIIRFIEIGDEIKSLYNADFRLDVFKQY